jgi:cell division initiation protein
MKLSPLDVRKQEFSRGMRGYDVDEVRAFLSTVAGQMDDLIEEQERSQNQLDDHRGRMGHLEDVQEALQATLNMARQNAEETRKAAMSKAEMILHEAQLKGEEILKKAEREMDKLRADITHLETRRDQILAKLRSVLGAELEMLESLRPEPADRQVEPAAEMASLSYVDPAARAHKQELLAKAAAAAARVGTTTQEIKAEDSVGTDNPPEEVQNIADVVAALKAEVDGTPDNREPEQEDSGELEEMQKIRRILDDLE